MKPNEPENAIASKIGREVSSFTRKRLGKIAQNPYNRLLLTLLFALGSRPFLSGGLQRLTFSALTLLIVVMTISVSRWSQHAKLWYFVLAGLALTAQSLESDYNPIYLSSYSEKIGVTIGLVLNIGLLSLGLSSFTHHIFRKHVATADSIRGGICGYVLLGVVWMLIYETIRLWQPDAFAASCTDCQVDLFYFSFTTLSTVGYGDISPTTAVARAAANFQAIVGTMYPAIFISRLVGLYSRDDR